MKYRVETKFKKTEIGLIPGDWEVNKLSEIVHINPNRFLSFNDFAKFIPMDALEPFSKHIKYFLKRKYSGGPRFKNKDTVLAKITPCLENGKTAYINNLNNKEIAFDSSEFIVFSGKENVSDSEYVYYKLISSDFRKAAIKSMVGTSGRQRVQLDMIKNFLTTIPELKEQKAIADILKSLDDKIEFNNQINQTLEQIAQSIFKHWFIDFEFPNEQGLPYKSSGGEMAESELGKIPKGWKVTNIGRELVTVLGGTPDTKNKSFWSNGEIAWINSGEVNNFRIISPTAYITELAIKNSATKLMPKGTTVIAITGATLGKVSRIEIESCANQSVVGILESQILSSEYIYFWIKNKISELISFQTGGAQQHINKNNINNCKILIPEIETIKEFNKIVKLIFEKINLNCFQSQTLSQIRDTLLPKLMTGKIRVSPDE